MAISSTPTDYSNLCTGALAAAITTSTSTNVTVTADSFLTPAGSGAVTWPTGNQIWKVSRKTRTNTQVEFLGVESLSQSGTAITTGAIVRYLPSNGSSLASQGSGLAFHAGSTVELVWHAWNAEQSFYKDVVNTITGSGAIRSSSTTTPIIRLNNVTTTQRNAMTPSNGDMVYDTTDNLTYGYVGGAWTNLTGGSVADATTSAKGKVQLADLTAVTTPTLGRVLTTDLIKQNSTGAAQGNVPALNSSSAVDVTIGGTGKTSLTSGALLLGAGTSAVTLIGPGSSGQVPTSNGTTIAMANPVYYDKTVYLSAVSSTTVSNTSSATNIDTHTYTIPANDLVAGVCYEFEIGYTTHRSLGTMTNSVKLGSTVLTSILITPASGGSTGTIRGMIMGTAAAGASVAVRSTIAIIHDQETSNKFGSSVETGTTVATNGTLVLQFAVTFSIADVSNTITYNMCKIRKSSTTAF